MPRAKLTATFCKDEPHGNKLTTYFDTDVTGLALRITKTGVKTFYYVYRMPRATNQSWLKLGRFGDITAAQAKKLAADAHATKSNNRDPGLDRKLGPTETIAELGRKYLAWMTANKKPGSVRQAEIMLRVHINPKIGRMPLDILARRDIRALTKDMTPRTAGKVIQILRAMLNKAEIDEPPWDQAMKPGSTTAMFAGMAPHLGNKRTRALSQDELNRLLDAIGTDKNPWHRALFLLAIFTGARIGEIKSAKWEWVDLENRWIDLPDSKTGARRIHLNQAAVDAIECIQPIGDNPWLIPGARKGEHLVNHNKIWARYCEIAEIEGVRTHDLRHTFASLGVTAGLTLEKIGALLGHSTAETTQRYAHLIDGSAKDAVERIGREAVGR